MYATKLLCVKSLGLDQWRSGIYKHRRNSINSIILLKFLGSSFYLEEQRSSELMYIQTVTTGNMWNHVDPRSTHASLTIIFAQPRHPFFSHPRLHRHFKWMLKHTHVSYWYLEKETMSHLFIILHSNFSVVVDRFYMQAKTLVSLTQWSTERFFYRIAAHPVIPKYPSCEYFWTTASPFHIITARQSTHVFTHATTASSDNVAST